MLLLKLGMNCASATSHNKIMVINVGQVLTNFDGSDLLKQHEFKDEKGVVVQAKEFWTLRGILDQALSHPDNQDKMQCFRLGRKLYEGDKMEITDAEGKLMEECVTRTFPSPVIVGQIHDIIAGATVEAAKPKK